MCVQANQNRDQPILVETWSNPQSLAAYIRGAQENLLNIIPPSSFEDKFTTFPSRFADTHYISDPEILRIVFKTQYEEFPKSKSTLVLLEPLVPDSIFLIGGEKWKSMHKTMMPVFNRRNVESFAPAIEAITTKMLDEIASYQGANDVTPLMQELTFRVISQVLTGKPSGTDFDAFRGMFEEFLDEAARFKLIDFPAVAFDFFPNTRKWRYREQIKAFRRNVRKIVRERLRTLAEEHQDFLEFLIEAYELRSSPSTSKAQMVEDNLVTFLIAGHETTSMTLAWGLYAATFYPKLQEKMAKEARLPWNKRVITDAFLKEVMRFYPPVPLLSRVNANDAQIKGLSMKRRDGVLVPVIAIHRHKDLWDRPDEFLPERFVDFTPAPMTYLPFGAGPRVCIGQSFAMMEANIIFPMILERFLVNKTDHAPEPELVITLRSKNGIIVDFQEK